MIAGLKEIYKKAWNEGIWIRELDENMAAAGCLKDLEKMEKKLGKKIKIEELALGDCVNLGCLPGTGKTRQESCNNAILKFKELHHKHLKYHNIHVTRKGKQTLVNSTNVLEGRLSFHSETGTEGGYWAFQDKKFITKNTTRFTCKKCCRYWDKKENPDGPIDDPTDRSPSKEPTDFRRPNSCKKDEHEFVLVYPEDWSYEGLHILENRDHLTIYCKENPEKVLWSGVISLKQHPLFTQGAFSFWIHADQKGMDREAWATYFFKNHPAKLIPFKKTTT